MMGIQKVLISLSLATFSVGAFSTTLEDCSTLLPEGYAYKVEITLNVDKSSAEPDLSGNFSVTSGVDEAVDFDISEFVECAGPLIKNAEGHVGDKPET